MAYNRFDQWDLQCDLEKAKGKKRQLKKTSGDGIAAQYGVQPKQKVLKSKAIAVPRKKLRKEATSDIKIDYTKTKKNRPNDIDVKTKSLLKHVPNKFDSSTRDLKLPKKSKEQSAASVPIEKKRKSSTSKCSTIERLDKKLSSPSESLPVNKKDRVKNWVETHFTDSDVCQFETGDESSNINDRKINLPHTQTRRPPSATSSISSASPRKKKKASLEKPKVKSSSSPLGLKSKQVKVKCKRLPSLASDKTDLSSYAENIGSHQVTKAPSLPSEILKSELEKTVVTAPSLAKRIRPASFVLQITAISTSTQTDITGPIFEKLCNGEPTSTKEEEIEDTEGEIQKPFLPKFKVNLGHDQFHTRVAKEFYDSKHNDLQPWFETVLNNYSPKVVKDPDHDYNCFISLTSRFAIMLKKDLSYLELLPEFSGDANGGTWWNNDKPPRIFTKYSRDFYRKHLPPEYVDNIPDLTVTRLYKV